MEVLQRVVGLGLQRILAKKATDVWKFSSKSHLCSLSLASKAAKTVLNDSICLADRSLDVGDDAVDLKLQLGVEEIGQGARVDDRWRAADQQNTSGVRVCKVRLLRGLDAVPHDAGVVVVDTETMHLTLGEELLSDLSLEEHHLRRTARVATLNLRFIDVDSEDAAHGSKLVDRGQQFVSGQGRWEVDDEERAVEMLRNILALVGWQVNVALVVGAEVALDSSNWTSLSVADFGDNVAETELLHGYCQMVDGADGKIGGFEATKHPWVRLAW